MAPNDMIDVRPEVARVLRAWVEAREPDADGVPITVGDVSDEEWESALASLSSPVETHLVASVICRAHELLARAPSDARRLARLALQMTQRVNRETCSDIDLLEGDAWRECAAAYLEMSEYVDAYDAVVKARSCYLRSPASRLSAAILSLLEGRALFELGRGTEALAAIERGSDELRESGADPKKYVQAKTMYASILAAMGRPGEALDIFADAADLAEKAGDREALAYIVWNTGICATKIGDTASAKRCFDRALRYFDRLGLKSELPHVRAALASSLKQEGRYNDAISELFKVRAEFLSNGIPVAAAIASLRIAEILLLCGRASYVPAYCDEMLRTFRTAGLQKNLLTALAYLRESSTQREINDSDITRVEVFFETAVSEPDLPFSIL